MTDDATLDRAGRLPSELSGLIGRRRELAELSALLAGTRLLTLTGPGGAGKSRLALALAEERRDQGVGVWWADLAGAAGAGMVTQLVAGAIVPPRQGCADAVEGIARVLAGRPALLCLDNCEHVAEACAELAAALLGECAGLSILATSRRSLGVPGEQVWRVAAWRCRRPTGRAATRAPSSCSPSAPGARTRASRSRARAPPSSASAGAWTASRWPSSSPPRA